MTGHSWEGFRVSTQGHSIITDNTVKLDDLLVAFGSYLFDGGDGDDKEQGQSAGHGAGGSVDDQLHIQTITEYYSLVC